MWVGWGNFISFMKIFSTLEVFYGICVIKSLYSILLQHSTYTHYPVWSGEREGLVSTTPHTQKKEKEQFAMEREG